MKKIIFGIFAHPDDEAFGPAGTLLMEAKAGNDVHLVTLTAGDAGMNPDNHAHLGEVRLSEWKKAGALIGAKTMHFLGYNDGQLGNQSMIEISEKLTEIITTITASEPDDVEIELMSMDLNGITGHIDHIVAGRASCFVFYSLKATDPRFTRIRLACISAEQQPEANISWLYMEAGHPASDIDETIDAREYKDELVAIINAHYSQRSDGQAALNQMGDLLGINTFIVKI